MSKPVLGIAYGFYAGKWIGHSTSHLFELLKTQFGEAGIDVQKIGLLDTAVYIKQNELEVIDLITGQPLRELVGMHFANWRNHPEFALAAAEDLKRNNKPMLVDEILRVLPMSKLGEMVLLSGKHIPLPDSIFMRSKHWLKQLKKDPVLPFGDQCIVKSITGSMGERNYLVTDVQEFRRILREDKDILYVVQEFIPNTCDYRLIVIGGEVKIVIRRSRVNAATHVNNTSKGAHAVIVPLAEVPEEMIMLAKQAAKAVGRSAFSGVDILQDSVTGAYYVLEVNKTPQMETGSHTTEKVSALVQYFRERI